MIHPRQSRNLCHYIGFNIYFRHIWRILSICLWVHLLTDALFLHVTSVCDVSGWGFHTIVLREPVFLEPHHTSMSSQNLSPKALSQWPRKNMLHMDICSRLQQAHQQKYRHTMFLSTSWPIVMVKSLRWEDPFKASSLKTRLGTLQTLLLMHALCPCRQSSWCSGCSNPSVSLSHSESHSSAMSFR